MKATAPEPALLWGLAKDYTNTQPEQSRLKEAPCFNTTLLLKTNGKLSIFNLHFKTKASNIQTINLFTMLSQQNLLPTMCFVVIKIY